jgi:hypothetical protein
MAVTTIGNLPKVLSGSVSDGVMQPDGYDFRVSFDASVTATVTYCIDAAGFDLDKLPLLGSSHPDEDRLKVFEIAASRESGSIMKVALTYKGIGNDSGEDVAQTEFNAGTTSEPIETHPKFAYPFSAPPVIPQELSAVKRALENNVDYGKENKFIGVAGEAVPATQAGRLLYILKKFGIESYLTLGGTFRRTYVSETIPIDYSNVGYITIPKAMGKPAATAPGVLGGTRNYLQTSLTWKKQANLVTITEEFMLSGASGFNIHVYEKPQSLGAPERLSAADTARVPL